MSTRALIIYLSQRMWKDQEGRIVTKKPTLPESAPDPLYPPQTLDQDPLLASINFLPFSEQQEGAPISPPISNNSVNWDDHDSGLGIGFSTATVDPNTLSSSHPYSPIDQQLWSNNLSQPQLNTNIAAVFDDAPFDDIFNPDTASSFNNPFTTMSNYNWLFDMDLSKVENAQQPLIPGAFQEFPFENSTPSQPSHAYDLQLDHMIGERTTSTAGQLGSLNSQSTNSPQHQSTPPALITPQSSGGNRKSTGSPPDAHEQSGITTSPALDLTSQSQQERLIDVERPMSMLYPSRSLPIIDELARAQVLDLIDITQPTAPDGSIVMRDHSLLTLSCLQTYCDLFFTRFNTVYPLIHMRTFDPSEVDTLLLISVLLLGATYGEKDAHQLAVGPISSQSLQC
jgi:hypothetical protein